MVSLTTNLRGLAVALFLTTINNYIGTTTAFVVVPATNTRPLNRIIFLNTAEEDSSSFSAPSSTLSTTANNNNNINYSKWATDNGITLHEKIKIRDTKPEERGKGGINVAKDTDVSGIKALEVLARIPRSLIIADVDSPDRVFEAVVVARNISWATDLTATTLTSLHPVVDEADLNSESLKKMQARHTWISSWIDGGWATRGEDLGPDEVKFGSKDVAGSLLSTGSDNDHNVYAKFRMPCHPCIHRASLGLKVLTGASEDECRNALTARGFTYRSMRDALEPLVLTPSERPKGSKREKRCWDVADVLSKVLSRATIIELEVEASDDAEDDYDVVNAYSIVPIHERLQHSLEENAKLISADETNEILLVATRDIKAGEPITRDYTKSPRLKNDESDGDLRLLLQFSIPPTSTITE